MFPGVLCLAVLPTFEPGIFMVAFSTNFAAHLWRQNTKIVAGRQLTVEDVRGLSDL